MEEENLTIRSNIYTIKEELTPSPINNRHASIQMPDTGNEYYTEEMRIKLQQLQKAMLKSNSKENKYSTPDQNNKIKSLKKRLNTREPLIEQINDFHFQEENITISDSTTQLQLIHINGVMSKLTRQHTENSIQSKNLFQNINIDFQQNKLVKENSLNLDQQKAQKIDSKTLSKMLMNEQIKAKTLIIDCRFNYEFKGGHIESALNIDNPQDLENLLFQHYDLMCPHFLSFVKQLHKYLQQYENTVKNINYRQLFEQFTNIDKENMSSNSRDVFLVFHCEFSKERSPKMIRFLQKIDGKGFYPYIYLLQGGYESFVNEFGELCEPNDGYTSMFNKKMYQSKVENQAKYEENWNKMKAGRNRAYTSIY